MKLSPENLQKLCSIAISAAKKAGELISSYSNQEILVKNKAGGTSLASQVVTEVDIKSEAIILEELNPTLKTYDLALLTEESTDDKSRFEKDYFWCIDPLDGTLPFTEQKSGYAISIALVAKEGTPQIGVVYDPLTKTLYHSIKGQGVFRNNEKWELNKIDNTFTFVCDRSFKSHSKFEQIIKELKAFVNKKGWNKFEIISHGGAAMNAIWVLEKAPACYFKLPKNTQGGGSLWDYAATACVFKEIGASATNIHGEKLDLNRKDSTFMNHQGVVYSSDIMTSDFIQKLF